MAKDPNDEVFDLADGVARVGQLAPRHAQGQPDDNPLDVAFFREEYFPVMRTIREIGGVEKLASMIEFAMNNLCRPIEPDLAEELDDHSSWVASGRDYEKLHGTGSLVDTTHPTYVATEPARRRFQAWLRSLELRG